MEVGGKNSNFFVELEKRRRVLGERKQFCALCGFSVIYFLLVGYFVLSSGAGIVGQSEVPASTTDSVKGPLCFETGFNFLCFIFVKKLVVCHLV